MCQLFSNASSLTNFDTFWSKLNALLPVTQIQEYSDSLCPPKNVRGGGWVGGGGGGRQIGFIADPVGVGVHVGLTLLVHTISVEPISGMLLTCMNISPGQAEALISFW